MIWDVQHVLSRGAFRGPGGSHSTKHSVKRQRVNGQGDPEEVFWHVRGRVAAVGPIIKNVVQSNDSFALIVTSDETVDLEQAGPRQAAGGPSGGRLVLWFQGPGLNIWRPFITAGQVYVFTALQPKVLEIQSHSEVVLMATYVDPAQSSASSANSDQESWRRSTVVVKCPTTPVYPSVCESLLHYQGKVTGLHEKSGVAELDNLYSFYLHHFEGQVGSAPLPCHEEARVLNPYAV